MIERILIPVDFSKASRRALEFAHQQFPHAKIKLLHVIDDFGISAAINRAQLRGIEDQQEALEAYQTDMQSDLNALGEGEVLQGQAAPIILEQARVWGADLIVMGTHGRHGLEHLILGSVAEQVIRTSQLPVLTLTARG
jgi:nucleotide-binding universal stress UspA family protein